MTTPKLPKLPKGWSWRKSQKGKLIELCKTGIPVGNIEYFQFDAEWFVYRRCVKTGMFLSIPASQHEDGSDAVAALVNLFKTEKTS